MQAAHAPKEQSAGYDSKYDFLKFFLSLLVLAIHSELYPMVLYPWLRIAVPLFFVMSAFFVFSKLNGLAPSAQKKILRQFSLRNLKLYFGWFVLLLPLTLYLRRDLYLTEDILTNVLNFLKSLFFGSTFIASWFLPALVFGVWIVFFLGRLLRRNWALALVVTAVFGFVTLSSSYTAPLKGTPLLNFILGYTELFGEPMCSFPAALFWVFVGKCFAEAKGRKIKLPVFLILLLFSCAALFCEWRFVYRLDGSYNNDSYFALAPVCILLFALVQKIKLPPRESSRFFKRASTVIYVTHGSLLPVVKTLFSFLFSDECHVLFAFVGTLLFSLCVYAVLELAAKKGLVPKLVHSLF